MTSSKTVENVFASARVRWRHCSSRSQAIFSVKPTIEVSYEEKTMNNRLRMRLQRIPAFLSRFELVPDSQMCSLYLYQTIARSYFHTKKILPEQVLWIPNRWAVWRGSTGFEECWTRPFRMRIWTATVEEKDEVTNEIGKRNSDINAN